MIVKKLRRRCRAATPMLVLALSGCASLAPPDRTTDELVLPEAYTLYDATAEAPVRWWEQFESPALNGLVAEALSGNFTLQQAYARIDQAVALLRQNRSALFPQVGYSADAGIRATHSDAGFGSVPAPSTAQRLNALGTVIGPGSGTGTVTGALRDTQSRLNALQTLLTPEPNNEQTINTEEYSLGLTANYEVDLWGRLRAAEQASGLELMATQEDLFAAMQSVAGQVVLTWLDLLQIRQTLAVTRDQLATNEQTLELIELRFRKGLANALDVFQQRQAVAGTETVLPPLEAQEQVLLHELAILLGKEPRAELDLGGPAYPDAGPLPDYGIPADLLARRPDVRTAGLLLQAADWRVSAARADRLPALTLNAGFSFNGDEFDMIFDNWVATLASSVTGPIFDAGRRRAEVDRTRAVVDERLNAYRLTVLTAVAEVENALVQIDRQEAFIKALREQYVAARNTHEEALNRYRKGLSDYLPVLSALTTAQNLERSVIESEHDLLVLRVQLHLALGGDWMPEAARTAIEEVQL
jgi:NodT family efflux transporter outer membrane factor (OMF) lipoprotein